VVEPDLPPDVNQPEGEAELSPFATIRARTLILYILLVAALMLFVGAALNPEWRQDSFASVLMLVVYLTILLVLIVRGSLGGIKWGRLFGPAPRLRDLPLLGVIVPLGLVTAATLILLFVPLSYIAPELVEKTILSDSPMANITTAAQFALLALNVVVIAPIVEELFFRGFLLQRFAYKWGTYAGVISSSALFAVGHVEWIGHFVTGVAFGLIYLRTRSLWMCILTHALYNGMFVAELGWNVFTHQPEEVQTLADFRESLGPGMLTFVAAVLLFWFYLDLYWKEPRVSEVLVGDVPYDRNSAA
jgi:membrane protease YdiL (CAAX protease family)